MRDGWRETALGNLLRRRTTRLGHADEPRILTVTEGHGLVDQIEHWGRRVATADVSKYKVVEPNDVVYNVYLLWNGAIGQNLFADRAVTSPVYEVFAPTAEVAPRLLRLILQSPQMIEAFDAISIGTIPRRRRAPWQDFLRLPVRIPPLDDQRRIVDLIGALDDTIAAAETAVSRAEAHLHQRAELIHEFRDGQVQTLGTIAPERGLVGGPFGSSLTTKHYTKAGVPVIRGTNMHERWVTGPYAFVSESKADELHRNIALPGDVIFTQRGTIGQVSMVPDGPYDRYVVSQSQMRLRVDASRDDARFYYYAFLAPRMVRELLSRNTATANPHINLGILASIEVPRPPLDAQQEVADLLDDLSTVKDRSLALVDRLRSLRSNLLTALLSGEHEIPESYDELMEEPAA